MSEGKTHRAPIKFSGLPAILRSPMLLLGLLAAQFALAQLLTGVQFGDATRNMHWGLLTFENPAFLLGDVDRAERINGFPPDPASLGPNERWGNGYHSFHSWWGPVAPLIFATVWGITRSYTLLQLVVPVAGGITVILTFMIARDLLDQRRALLATVFLSCFPLFREYSSVSYIETLSALWITTAFLSYLRGRTATTVLFGTLATLSKMDMLAMYGGVIAVCAAWDVLRREGRYPLRHHIIALVIPLLLATPWIWFHTLNTGNRMPTEPLSAEIFGFLLPQLIEMTFYAPLSISLISLAVIGIVIAAGLHARAIPTLPTLLLGTWIGIGFLITLVYGATPGAGNSPRIIIPALPALAILFGAGMPALPSRLRSVISIYIIALFIAVNIKVIDYETTRYGAQIRAAAPAFATLRESERGFVLTPLYWETILYTRQPATWFESDRTFEHNMMRNEINFAHYVESNPIRYVLLPRIGDIASPEVRAYLDTHARTINSGEMILYVLSKPEHMQRPALPIAIL